MLDRRFFAETAAVLVAAVLCATVANAVASRERKLAWAGDYPNARVVPPLRAPDPAEPLPALSAPEPATATVAPVIEAPPLQVPGAAVEVAKTPSAATQPPARPAPAARAWTLADFQPHPDKPAVDIRPEQAKALWDLRVPFLDARRSQIYEQGHIAGARRMPVWESDIDELVNAFYEEGHDGELPLVIYCSGGNCEDSHMLAQKLWGFGFNNIQVYTGGFPDWQERGFPIERGPAS